MQESLMILDNIRLNFSTEGLFFLNLTLAFIMFGVALEIRISHFAKILLNPKGTFVGILSQFLVLPAVTFLVVYILRDYITQSVALGMILIAACPGGNISNFISSYAKGNVALSVSLTAIATLAAIFMTPINFMIWGGLYNASSSLLVPLEIPIRQMFQTVFILLGIPLILGMMFSWYFPVITQKIVRPFKIFSIIIFLGFVVVAFVNNLEYLVLSIKYIFVLVLLHNSLAFISGFLMGSTFKLAKPDIRSVTIETGIQNSGLALVLIFNPKIFPLSLETGGMAFIAAWWGIWHILAGLGIASFWSRKRYILKHEKA